MLGVTGILVGTVFLASVFMQTVMGFSALRTGLAFLPSGAARIVSGWGSLGVPSKGAHRHP
jgi:hypothetical protein